MELIGPRMVVQFDQLVKHLENADVNKEEGSRSSSRLLKPRRSSSSWTSIGLTSIGVRFDGVESCPWRVHRVLCYEGLHLPDAPPMAEGEVDVGSVMGESVGEEQH